MQKSIKNNPNDTLSYIFKFKSFLNNNLIDEAFQAINDVVKKFSDYSNSYFQRGYIKYIKLEYDNAIDDFVKSLNLLPNEPVAYVFIALCYEVKKDYDKALSNYETSLATNSKNAFTYFYKGKLLGTLGKYQDAIYNYYQALIISPEYSEAYYFRGLTKIIETEMSGCADLKAAYNLVYKEAYKLILDYCEK